MGPSSFQCSGTKEELLRCIERSFLDGVSSIDVYMLQEQPAVTKLSKVTTNLISSAPPPAPAYFPEL